MTTTLNRNPACRCCATIRDYIASHLDPHGTIERGDNAQEYLDAFNDTFRDEGGAGVSVEDLQAYIDEQ